MFAGFEEGPRQWNGRPHRRGDRELRQERPPDPERDARREGVFLRGRARNAGHGRVQPRGPAGDGGQGVLLPAQRLPGGGVQEPSRPRQQDEGQMLGRPLGRGHWGDDGPQPPHPKGRLTADGVVRTSQ